jgi:hypothetical protein
MITLTREQLKEYDERGYLILRGILDLKPINEFMDFVAHVISLEGASLVTNKVFSKEEILNDLIINIKRENSSSSSWIYQTILGSYMLKEFFVKINILPLAMQLLKIEDKKNVGVVSPAFRFDIPGDVRNIREWHQDSNYFLENELGHEHLVAWIPLNKATKDNGSVIIAPNTHKNGRLTREHKKAEGFKSEQYTSPEVLYKDNEKDYIEAEPGDIAFINMDLLHSSGVNITDDSVRYTAQIRFNTINKKTFRPVFLKPEYPEYKRME